LTYDFGEQNHTLLKNVAAAFEEFNFSEATEQLNKITDINPA